MSRLTALSASASLVLVLALAVPAPALARNDTLKKLLLLGAAALVVKTVIDNQNRPYNLLSEGSPLVDLF